MVVFRYNKAMRSDVITRKAKLMTDIAFLLRLTGFSVVSWLAQTARERGRGPGLRVESGCLEMTARIYTTKGYGGLCGSTQSGLCGATKVSFHPNHWPQ